MNTWKSLGFSLAAFCCLAAPTTADTIQYFEDFESPDATSSQTTGPGGFVQVNNVNQNPGGWQVQGGGGAGGVTLTTGVDNNGVGGSQALFANWDHTLAAAGWFTFNQYTVYGVPGFGPGVQESEITVSLDVFMSGSESSNTPIEVIFQGNGGGVDRIYVPTLANGQYTTVSFTLDQATGGAVNLSQPFNVHLRHGAGGFGFDANNIVRIDNVSVSYVPEPATTALAAIGGCVLLSARRRGRRSA